MKNKMLLNKNFKAPKQTNAPLPRLACVIDNNSLLLLLNFFSLTGLIVHRQQVTLHGVQLHSLKHTQDIENLAQDGLFLLCWNPYLTKE